MPRPSAWAIVAAIHEASSRSEANAIARARPPAPRIAISAFGTRSGLCSTHATAASRISAWERKLRASTIRSCAGNRSPIARPCASAPRKL